MIVCWSLISIDGWIPFCNWSHQHDSHINRLPDQKASYVAYHSFSECHNVNDSLETTICAYSFRSCYALDSTLQEFVTDSWQMLGTCVMFVVLIFYCAVGICHYTWLGWLGHMSENFFSFEWTWYMGRLQANHFAFVRDKWHLEVAESITLTWALAASPRRGTITSPCLFCLTCLKFACLWSWRGAILVCLQLQGSWQCQRNGAQTFLSIPSIWLCMVNKMW